MAEKKAAINNKSQPKKLSLDRLTSAQLPGIKMPGLVRADEPPPRAPGSNPFKELPYPNPGDRIKADDYKKLSQSLKIIYDIYRLSGTLFGRSFGEAKLVLRSHQYEIQGVMTVFGTETGSLDDEKLDHRKVIQVLPVEPGEPRVIVILTEAVEIRRTVPKLIGKTYKEAREILGSALGDVAFPAAPMTTPDLIGASLSEVKNVR
jgi:hypothetical protein